MNPRYSLRAFAAFLGTDHSTLSQVFRGKRPIPVSQLRLWGRKLALAKEEVAAYIAAGHVPPDQVIARQERLRHWSAEALAISSDRIHWRIIELLRIPEFHPDTRWIATQIAVSTDHVNVALSRLLRLRLLEMGPTGKWKSLIARANEAQFRKQALIKVRELAAADGVDVRQPTGRPRK